MTDIRIISKEISRNVTFQSKNMNFPDRILIATSPQKELEMHPSDSLVTGFVAGILSRTMTSPIDVLKMIMQTNTEHVPLANIVRNIYQKDGIKGFWRGNVVACACNGPLTAVKYFVIDDLTKYIGKGKPMSSETRWFIGAVAGILSQSVCYPLDLIYTRITIHPELYTNVFQATGKIIKEEGFFGLWHGLMPTITGAIVYEGSQFAVSGGIKQFLSQKKHTLTAWQYLTIGACAGAVSQTISFPFDVMRRRMMIVDSNGNKKYHSYFHCFESIVRNEGIRGFFKGVRLNLVKVIPATAIQYTINEELKNFFENVRIAHEMSKQSQKHK